MKTTLKKHRFLLTGATGFIGANLLHQLVKQNCEVHLLIRKKAKLWRIQDLLDRVQIHSSDLSDQAQLTRQLHLIKPSIIYHLAAYGAYPQQTYRTLINQTNYFGTLNLLQASLSIPYTLFVNTGSSSEYGFKNHPMAETDLPEPNSDYAVSKVAATLLCAQVAKQTHKPIVTFRPFAVYGPWEEPNRLVPNLMKSLFYQQPLALVAPKVARDFVYIDDVVKLYLSINQLAKQGGQYFNLGTGRQSTIQQIVAVAEQISRRTLQSEWGTLPQRSWDANCWVANMTQTNQLLNWQARYSLAAGLQKTWTWFKKHHQFYD